MRRYMSEALHLEYSNALLAMKEGNYGRAIGHLSAIVDQNPTFEHGEAFYLLGTCYEELGLIDEADVSYRRALELDSKNWYFIGGYASFLFQFGNPGVAFDFYLELLGIEKAIGNENAMAETLIGLGVLAKRLGMSESELKTKLAEIK